jgi:putative ABC transport system ATP-binding protein
VLLADEPTGNLDTQRSEEIMELLWKLKRERHHRADGDARARHGRLRRRIVRFKDGMMDTDTPNEPLVLRRAALDRPWPRPRGGA